MLWSYLGSIASVITAIVATIALIPVVKSLVQADRNLRFSIYNEVFEMLEKHREEKEAFDAMIISNEHFNIMEDLSEEERQKYYKLARLYDRWGQLVLHGVLPIDFILDFYSRPLMLTWKAMHPYIETLRRIRVQPGHMAKFQFLAEEACNYRGGRYSGSYEFQKPKPLSMKHLWNRCKHVGQSISK